MGIRVEDLIYALKMKLDFQTQTQEVELVHVVLACLQCGHAAGTPESLHP